MKNYFRKTFFAPLFYHKRLFRIMKLTLFLTVAIVFSLSASNSYSQNMRMSLKLENVKLKNLFYEIKKQSDFSFLYNNNELDNESRVTLSVKDRTISDILDIALKGKGLAYEIDGKFILIYPADSNKKEELKQQIQQQQKKSISGTVRDAKGEPIIGASVVVEGTTNGVATDENGAFNLSVTTGNSIKVNFLGFTEKVLPINDQTKFDIILHEDTKYLDEVVVVTYGTQKKRDITGAINTIKGDALTDIPVAQIGQKLQGQVAGVQINQTSGAPGQGMAFRIRGAASISNASEPLFVVDGIPISTGLNNINPDEIETFSVLKDASATALYGSRAANGVILITTKKGKKGKTQVTLHANYGVQSVNGLQEINVMNAREFAQFKKEFYEDQIKYEGSTDPVPEMYQHPEQYGEGTNWYKLLLRSAPIQSYSLSVSGGNDFMTTAVIGGYFKQEGVVRNSNFERYNLRVNNEFTLHEKVKLGFNVAPVFQIYNNQNTDGYREILSASLIADPCQSPYNKDGSLKVSLESPGMFGQPNWLRYLDGRLNNTRTITLISNAYANIDIWNGLKYKFQAGTDIGYSRNRQWASSLVGGGLFTPPPVKAEGSYDTGTYYNWTIENMLSYDKTFGNHAISLLLGYSAQKVNSEFSTITGTDFADDEVPWLDAAATTKGSSSTTEWTVASLIGRANYTYKDRYLLQATIRKDGCSRFGEGNKYATFPSVSGGWIASEESFMKPVTKVMNYLKLRASYGVTGNNNIGDYSYIATLNKNNYVLGGTLAPGKSLGNIGNNDLTWEETKQLDLGVDVGFLNDRIFFMYDYYSKITDGLLYQIDIPWSSGFSDISANVGRFDTWGHEFTLESRNIVGDFNWKTNLNITIPRNKVVKLSTNNTPIGGDERYADWNRLQVGQPIGVFYGYVFDGVYMTQEEFDTQPKHWSSEVGTARMKDVDKNGYIDENDRTIIGNPNPDVLYGITNEFSWKNFDLSVLISGQLGGDVFLGSSDNSFNLDGVFNVDREVKNRWRSLENPGNGKVPRTLTGTTEIFRLKHSGWVYDASYMTLRNVTLGYTIPFKPNKYISKARIYFSGQQLFTVTGYPGLNPEINNNEAGKGLSWSGMGVDMTTYPIPRTFTIGLDITF